MYHADSAGTLHHSAQCRIPQVTTMPTVMVLIENAGGATRHTHPGLEMTYILEGERVTLMVDGRADQARGPATGSRFLLRCRTA